MLRSWTNDRILDRLFSFNIWLQKLSIITFLVIELFSCIINLACCWNEDLWSNELAHECFTASIILFNIRPLMMLSSLWRCCLGGMHIKMNIPGLMLWKISLSQRPKAVPPVKFSSGLAESSNTDSWVMIPLVYYCVMWGVGLLVWLVSVNRWEELLTLWIDAFAIGCGGGGGGGWLDSWLVFPLPHRRYSAVLFQFQSNGMMGRKKGRLGDDNILLWIGGLRRHEYESGFRWMLVYGLSKFGIKFGICVLLCRPRYFVTTSQTLVITVVSGSVSGM